MWFFNSPEVIFGEGALGQLDELPGKRAFIVTDPTLHKLGFTERIAEHLHNAGMEVACFAEVEPEPSLHTVFRGAELLSEFEPDWIIGLGGGSAMDAAKAMWAIYELPGVHPAELNPIFKAGVGAKARLCTIPTTAGTGAEATYAIVLTDTEEGRKVPVGARDLMPTLAIVDPSMTAALPPHITADTGLDVLVHAIEGYTSTTHNDFSDGLCLKAAQMVFEYLPRAVADGTDEEAREKMANAATIGGLGFGNSMAALAHTMGHSLGAAFHLPHGRCVGVYLPYTIAFSANAGLGRYPDIAYALRLPGDDVQTAAKSLVEATQNLMLQIGQPLRVSEMGLGRSEHENALERLADLGETDTQIAFAPRIPNREELEELYRRAYDGRPVDF